jgi:hypothetical protein
MSSSSYNSLLFHKPWASLLQFVVLLSMPEVFLFSEILGTFSCVYNANLARPFVLSDPTRFGG